LAASASRGRSSPFKPCQALEVIGQVGHTDLDAGAGDVTDTLDLALKASG